MKEVAIVLVSWGRLALLQTTLTSLFATTNPDEVSVTVVDNGSKQDVIDYLISRRNQIDNLVLLNKNKGKPYALNIGATTALHDCIALNLAPPEFFLFCDSDLFFRNNWLSKMVTSYKEHRILTGDKPLGGLSGYVHAPHQLTLHKGKTTEVNEIKFCAGCCLMMSKDVFLKNGPWDTRRLIRTVDTRYLRNLIRRGYMNAAVYPASVIEHTGKRSRTWHISKGTPKYIP